MALGLDGYCRPLEKILSLNNLPVDCHQSLNKSWITLVYGVEELDDGLTVSHEDGLLVGKQVAGKSLLGPWLAD